MRRDLVVAVISVWLSACSSGDGGELAGDGGDVASAREDASVPVDARVEEASDDGGLDAGSSAGLDAGTSGAAGRDGGRDGGPPHDAGASASTEAGSGGAGCAGKSYKLCEDFESASAGALPSGWTKVSAWGGGDALVADDEAHSGSKSLKGADTATGQTRAGKSLSALGATADKHWG